MPFSLSAHKKPGQHPPDSTIFLKYSFILPLNAISADAIFNAVCYQQHRLRLAQQLGLEITCPNLSSSPGSPRSVFHGILPTAVINRSNSALLKSRAVNLQFALFPSLKSHFKL